MSAEALGPIPPELAADVSQALALNRAARTVAEAATLARDQAAEGLRLGDSNKLYRLSLAVGDVVIASDGARRQSISRELFGKLVVARQLEFVDPNEPYPDLLRFYPLSIGKRFASDGYRFYEQGDEPRIAIGLPGDLLTNPTSETRLQRVPRTQIYGLPEDRFATIRDLDLAY